jgi:hypothetical protein
MKQNLIVLLYLTISCYGWSQQRTELPFGEVKQTDLISKSYALDTGANAIVLNEIGNAYISEENLIYEYYVKIKILSQKGFGQADFLILLNKSKERKVSETLYSIRASTYNLKGIETVESRMESSNVFTEKNEEYDLKKFTLPDIHEGSVIEVKYAIESPFIFNFHTWEFQSDIPKIHSEYWARIPANYVYNVALRGYLKLTKNESFIVKDCFSNGGGKSDCSQLHYAMDNVPAFKEDDYMTAKTNFLSALYFELSEIQQFDGRVNKITKEWRDVDAELRKEEKFGLQIKKASDLLEEDVKKSITPDQDELAKAKIVFDLIKGRYLWNGNNRMFGELGAKQSFESRKGSSADINLALVAALQVAGLNAYPVLLSTRDHGLPIELYPVISGFNYVVAYVEIKGITYLLDATNVHHPFGFLPMRCLNGKGRLMTKVSSWIEIKPQDKQKTVTTLDLTMKEDGSLSGKLSISYLGYDAFARRSLIFSATDKDEYVKKLETKVRDIEVSNYRVENLENLESPLMEKTELKIPSDVQPGANTIYFDPFIFEKWGENRLKSSERSYPVDFGAPIEHTSILTLNFPSTFEVDELPKSVALALPQGGGRYVFSVTQLGNKLVITGGLTLTRAVYNSSEYHYLRELFTRMVQIEHSQIVFKKK